MNGLNRFALAALVTSAVGCTNAPAPGASDLVQAATGPATVTTDAASYTYATPIGVTFSGVDGASGDWVAIAPMGSPLTTTTRWKFTGGGTSGSLQFEGPPTGGTYVARAFDTDSNLMGESDPFVTADPSQTHATVAATQASYTMTDPITIAFTGMPGNTHDWIAIAPQGFPVNDQAEWQFTGGGVDGSVTFTGGFQLTNFPAGTYVARAYLNNTFTLVAESTPFTIGTAGAPAITTDRASYTTLESINVTWASLPGNAKDWIAIAPVGADPTNAPQWRYTNGAVNGSASFNANTLTPGINYVARAFVNDTYTVIAQSTPFALTAAGVVTVVTDQTTYAVDQPIAVTWNGLPGNTRDWVGYAPMGSPDTTVTHWLYAQAMPDGTLTLPGAPAPGTYVARTFVNDSYSKAAESAPFVVQ